MPLSAKRLNSRHGIERGRAREEQGQLSSRGKKPRYLRSGLFRDREVRRSGYAGCRGFSRNLASLSPPATPSSPNTWAIPAVGVRAVGVRPIGVRPIGVRPIGIAISIGPVIRVCVRRVPIAVGVVGRGIDPQTLQSAKRHVLSISICHGPICPKRRVDARGRAPGAQSMVGQGGWGGNACDLLQKRVISCS